MNFFCITIKNKLVGYSSADKERGTSRHRGEEGKESRSKDKDGQEKSRSSRHREEDGGERDKTRSSRHKDEEPSEKRSSKHPDEVTSPR